MNWVSRLIAMVVLVGMAAALPGLHAFALATAGQSQGCHGHNRTPLSPVSYQCCANGHNWAIAGSPMAVPAPAAVDSWVEFDSLSLAAPHFEVSAFLSSSPPSDLPLRI
jgi:hypothetical protein